MKKTSCSLMVFALAALTPPLVFGEATAESSTVPGASAPTLAGVPMTPAAPETTGQAALSSVAQRHGLEGLSAAESQATPAPAATALEPPPAPGGARRDDPPPYQSWIDKVRAQRKARLAEHREAMEARRNYLTPWDHPQHESIEVQREKRREAWQMHNERREQAQREYRRFTNPHGEYMKERHDARRQLMEAEAEQQRMQADLLWQRRQEWMYGQMPHGWNNPWYYRGY